MKEIKFRAWDFDNRQMFYSDREEDSGEGLIEWFIDANGIHFEEPTLVPWYDPDRIEYMEPNQVIMQFTGLHDKNGKAIYDGDFVRRKADFGTEQYPNIRELVEVVELREGCFCPVCEEPGGNFEVIGNIYENPELKEG